jgi:hypothetical protein
VFGVDFYNLNASFYQHEAEGIVSGQQYTERDENGFVGRVDYPWSAKLNTLKLEKVAFDLFEYKKNVREYEKEQMARSLIVIKKEDDFSELIFKMFEQIRLLNEELKGLG